MNARKNGKVPGVGGRSGTYLRTAAHLEQDLPMAERQERALEHGVRLRALRARAGLTQARVAEAFGTDHTNVSAWEAGRRPIPDSLQGWRALATLCRVSLATLLDYIEGRLSDADLDLHLPRNRRPG
jgi:DNA-binding XRE family transcriptional regulator